MSDEKIEAIMKQLERLRNDESEDVMYRQTAFNARVCIAGLKSERQLAETQLKELLSALYQRAGSEQGFTLYSKDIVELAKDYGIKEEELK